MSSSKAMDETRAADVAVTAGTRGMGVGAPVAIIKCADDDDEVDSWHMRGAFDLKCNGSHVLWALGGPLIPSIRLIQILPITLMVTASPWCYFAHFNFLSSLDSA
jgi:hypothetical protein